MGAQKKTEGKDEGEKKEEVNEVVESGIIKWEVAKDLTRGSKILGNQLRSSFKMAEKVSG